MPSNRQAWLIACPYFDAYKKTYYEQLQRLNFIPATYKKKAGLLKGNPALSIVNLLCIPTAPTTELHKSW